MGFFTPDYFIHAANILLLIAYSVRDVLWLRVFAVAAGSGLGRSSAERFDLARGLVPEQEALFREASETLRVVMFHQARAGIRQHSEGFDLPAAQISAQERLVLKSGFRSILRLLEFTEELSYDNPHGNVAMRLI
jgi:hypothetical protein